MMGSQGVGISTVRNEIEDQVSSPFFPFPFLCLFFFFCLFIYFIIILSIINEVYHVIGCGGDAKGVRKQAARSN